MHFASLLFGASIIAVAIGLETHRRRHEPMLIPSTDLDRLYVARRRRGRIWTHILLAVIGCLAALAGVAGTGRLWMFLWAPIPLILLAIVALACGDAMRTDRYLRAKLPELRDQTFGDRIRS